MGRHKEDHHSPVTEAEVLEMQRVLRGWGMVQALRESLLAAVPGEAAASAEESRVLNELRQSQWEALTIAITRPPTQDPDKALERFSRILADRHRAVSLEMIAVVVHHIRATGAFAADLPDHLKRIARHSVHPMAGLPELRERVDAYVAEALDDDQVRAEIEYAPSRGARAAVARLQGIAVSKLERDLAKMKAAARNRDL